MSRAFGLLLVLTASIAAGCGTNERAGVAAKPPTSKRLCDSKRVQGFRTCTNDTFPLSPSIEHRTGPTWTVVTGPLPHPESAASWNVVALSPDQSTLLAEWMYPCDSAAVVFVPIERGSPRIATGEKDWRQAPVAHALGWTLDGKARVRVYTAWWGHPVTPMRPRTFLIDPNGLHADPHPVPLRGC